MRWRVRPDRFVDRRAAGRQLAERLLAERADGWSDPLVLGLVRGGVPIAREIAYALDARLDVAVARKIGAPGRPELGVGAVTADGPPIFDRHSLAALDLTPAGLGATVAREGAEAARRLSLYRSGRPPLVLADRDVVLADDGLATGITARAAIRSLRRGGPRRIVLVAPVGSPHAVRGLRTEADEVICLREPTDLVAISRWYAEFGQVSDEEVLRLLAD